MVIGTCKSAKHMCATYERFNKIYKKKRQSDDIFTSGKGKTSGEKWCAIDCGNIVIHLFQSEFREMYDLESLWTVGYEYDEKYQEILLKQKEMDSKLESIEV